MPAVLTPGQRELVPRPHRRAFLGDHAADTPDFIFHLFTLRPACDAAGAFLSEGPARAKAQGRPKNNGCARQVEKTLHDGG